MSDPKAAFAAEYIRRIRSMDPERLDQLITEEAGDELARFFVAYASTLIRRDPERVLENTSSLMLMGYLIRAAEERRAPELTLVSA